jgi:hypothetical protein
MISSVCDRSRLMFFVFLKEARKSYSLLERDECMTGAVSTMKR